MPSNFVAAFSAPLVAVAALGASFAGSFAAPAPYTRILAKLPEQEARAAATALFRRADLDGSGDLDADEYAALAIVTTELARLNGYITLDVGGETRVVPLDAPRAAALTRAERIRLEALARREFYKVAGADARLGAHEFGADKSVSYAAVAAKAV